MASNIVQSTLVFFIVYCYSLYYISLYIGPERYSLFRTRFNCLYVAGIPIFIILKFMMRDDLNVINWLFWCTWGISVIDFLLMLIPRNMIYGMISFFFFSMLQEDVVLMKQALYSAVALYGFFLLLYFVPKLILKKRMIGYGDVRLAGALGCFFSVGDIPAFVFFSSLSCLIWGVFISFLHGKTIKKLPLGPFMCLSMWMIYIR